MSQAFKITPHRPRITRSRRKEPHYSNEFSNGRESHIIKLSPRAQLALANSLLNDSDWEPNEFLKKVLKDYHNSVTSK